jgi:hypothetical protein
VKSHRGEDLAEFRGSPEDMMMELARLAEVQTSLGEYDSERASE